MKAWLILAVIAVSFAGPAEAEAQWWNCRYGAYYGYGYPVYTTYYPAPVYVAPQPTVVNYPPVVVRPIVAPPVLGYRPVTYSAYYAPPPYYYYGW